MLDCTTQNNLNYVFKKLAVTNTTNAYRLLHLTKRYNLPDEGLQLETFVKPLEKQ
jgi:hypothetical protein